MLIKKKGDTFHLSEAIYSHRRAACTSKIILKVLMVLYGRRKLKMHQKTDEEQMLPERH